MPKYTPLIKPCSSIASFAYSEHVGIKRHDEGKYGEINLWYNTIRNINIELEEVFGATTLSGDKLLNYFINDGESTLLFLAVENEARPNKAKIYEGIEAYK